MLGFSNYAVADAMSKPRNFSSQLDFEPSSSRKTVIGLYFDPNNPERQEIIDCKIHECKIVREINDAVLVTSAKNSPFYDQEVVNHFMTIIRGEASSAQPFLQSLLRNYLIRGFNNMILILHSSYMRFMAKAGLSKEFFAFFLSNASAEIELPDTTAQVTQT